MFDSTIKEICNFKTSLDLYNGLIIQSDDLPSNIKDFEDNLILLISEIQDNKNLVWIYINIEKSSYIPIAVKLGFIFHSCNNNYVLLVKKLKENSIIPTSANHTLGVGAVVVNDKNEILLIKEYLRNQFYKLPGGHIDDGEMISKALSREVFEETGICVEFEKIVSIGHFYPHQFNKSNLYILCLAKPKTSKIDIKDTKEIQEAIWLNINEMFLRDDIHEYTKTIVKSAFNASGLFIDNTFFLSKTKSNYELFFLKTSKN